MPGTSPTQGDGGAKVALDGVAQEEDAIKSPALTVVMPGSAEQNAQEIKAISPEGRPADPKAGPGALYGFLLLAILLLAVASLASVPWLGWAGAAMGLGFGALALCFNPELAATLSRAAERRHVLENRKRDHDHKAT
ncbi:MAG: hypothetical protein AABZ53_06435 [Planctomycetota bacterium]